MLNGQNAGQNLISVGNLLHKMEYKRLRDT